MRILHGQWKDTRQFKVEKYKCGYCDSLVGPSEGYVFDSRERLHSAYIYICPYCNNPTFIEYDGPWKITQVPGQTYGENIEHLPPEVEQLYNEARNCISVNAYTATAMVCRKILMNVAVSKGAEPDQKFGYYVRFLEEKNFIPPDGKEWVDHIREKGNEANHEIPSINKDEATELIDFVGMLLRFVYELPGRMAQRRKEKNE